MNDRLSQVAGLDSLKIFGNYLFLETAFLGTVFLYGQVAGLGPSVKLLDLIAYQNSSKIKYSLFILLTN